MIRLLLYATRAAFVAIELAISRSLATGIGAGHAEQIYSHYAADSSESNSPVLADKSAQLFSHTLQKELYSSYCHKYVMLYLYYLNNFVNRI